MPCRIDGDIHGQIARVLSGPLAYTSPSVAARLSEIVESLRVQLCIRHGLGRSGYSRALDCDALC